MDWIISLVIIIVIIVWAVRVETGINKINETLERIEKNSTSKKGDPK